MKCPVTLLTSSRNVRQYAERSSRRAFTFASSSERCSTETGMSTTPKERICAQYQAARSVCTQNMANAPKFHRARENPHRKNTWLTLRRGSRVKTKIASARLAKAANRGARRKKFIGP